MRLRALALCVVPLALMACCGGSSKPKTAPSNGEAAKKPAQIVADSVAAATAATSVHIVGSIDDTAGPLKVDLTLTSGKGGAGSVTVNGLTFDIVRIGAKAYFKAGPKFWQQFGGGAAAALLADRWIEASAVTGNLSAFTPLTDVAKLFSNLLGQHGGLKNIGTSTVDGQDVVGVLDTDQGGTLYIAATGPAFPISLRNTGKGGGVISFDHWNQVAPLTAPANAVPLSSLTK